MRKKINKFLDKKVSMAGAIWLVIFLYVISMMIILIKHDYFYIDINNQPGHSDKCYYNANTRHIECLVPIEIQQYEKR